MSTVTQELAAVQSIPGLTLSNATPGPSKVPATSSPSRPDLLCDWPECERTFAKPAKLKEHRLSHTGERPHQCSQCEARYFRLSHLQRHLNSHKDPKHKPFECLHDTDGQGHLPGQGSNSQSHSRSCGKRFWTLEKLRRHEKVHEDSGADLELKSKIRIYACPYCPSTFHKHIQLRSHALTNHQDSIVSESRASTPTRQGGRKRAHSIADDCPSPIVEGVEIRFRPFKCEFEGCGWGFETAQRLRVHKRVHETKRYICSHQSHTESPFPSFSKWSDLQNHIKADHPPVCPYIMCRGRTFKRNKNLTEHLKVHAEHGDSPYEPEAGTLQLGPGDVVDVKTETDMPPRGRKRTRDDDLYVDTEEDDGHPKSLDINKRLKRTESEVGKDWICDTDPSCDKKFKTKRALAVHHSTAHLGLRPFACPHTECDNTYGHKHLLQRHIAARHRELGPPEQPESESKILPTESSSMDPQTPTKTSDQTDSKHHAGLLTGMHALQKIAHKPLSCPCDLIKDESNHPSSQPTHQRSCPRRFSRVYDVQRHLAKDHHLELSEDETRLMLSDATAKSKSLANSL